MPRVSLPVGKSKTFYGVYKQERWGRGGIRFKAYKFRTMIPNSDELFGIKQASENDDRITRWASYFGPWGWMNFPRSSNG